VGGWGGSDYVKNILVDEKDHPYTGTRYAWCGPGCWAARRISGRLALRLSDYDFKGKTHDGYGEDWPISYADIEPYYDKVDLYLGISGYKEIFRTSRQPVPAAQQAHRVGADAAQESRQDGADGDAVSRRRDDRWGEEQVPQQVLRAGRVWPPSGGMRHPRGRSIRPPASSTRRWTRGT